MTVLEDWIFIGTRTRTGEDTYGGKRLVVLRGWVVIEDWVQVGNERRRIIQDTKRKKEYYDYHTIGGVHTLIRKEITPQKITIPTGDISWEIAA